MGLAELVPGVSGGTIAFISGIYYQLVSALSSFGPLSFNLASHPRQFWLHHHLGFLLALVVGMVAGILVFARLIEFMMEAAEPVLWAFFFGVIAVSVLQIGAARSPRYLAAYGALGVLAGLLFLSLPSIDMSESMFALFVAGMVAVSAWILPGISGSFVLLLLGLYDDVILAVNQPDWTFLLVLTGGCGSGLLLFTRALGWLLMRYEDALLAFLTGFMATALIKLWPWQIIASQSASDAFGVFYTLQSPQQYVAAGNEAYLGLSLMAALLGGTGIWLLSKLSPQ
ncbi:MAG: DUF368 domain-containing protein [Pseudomonadota bacterium]|nr:DUF368 domain-containing protein [Pseudomonadota bacterium]